MLTVPGRFLVAVLAVLLTVATGTAHAAADGQAGTAPVGTAEPSPGQSPIWADPTTGPGSPALLPPGLPGERPNIVVVMADDMREDELDLMPNVQRWIADRGVHFANAFSPYPLCCPARSSFLTGQYTHNHGVWSNKPPYGFLAFDDSSTLATDLSAAGYRTAMLGKYLNGYGDEPVPGNPAADLLRYVPPGWQDWRGAVRGTYNYRHTALNVNGSLRRSGGFYQTRFLGRQTADEVADLARSPRPFFLWASYVAPHIGLPGEPDDPEDVQEIHGREVRVSTPARPPDVAGGFDGMRGDLPRIRLEPDRTDKPGFVRDRPSLDTQDLDALRMLIEQRAEALKVLDQEVGDTIAALRAAGELDNTLVVFLSDNGYLLGEHGVLQGKLLPYEPSLRVPILMAGPGIPHGVTRRDPAMILDLAPTFLDIAGARSTRTMDGVSLLDMARNGDQGWTRPVFTESRPHPVPATARALLDLPEGPSRLRFTQGVRVPRYLYVEHATREKELYDLRRDPDELENVVTSARYERVVAELARVLERMRTCSGSSCAAPLPPELQQAP